MPYARRSIGVEEVAPRRPDFGWGGVAAALDEAAESCPNSALAHNTDAIGRTGQDTAQEFNHYNVYGHGRSVVSLKLAPLYWKAFLATLNCLT